jgi:phospholipid/cholesterol/gamma-HCH transport system substrate-binding protein
MNIMLRYRDQVVGAFVLAGIVLLVGALLFVGANKRWFKRDPLYNTRFLTAEGLSPGLALQLRGFAIGHVKQLRLGDDDQVEVTLSIHEEYADRIVAGSVLELAVQPLGFGSSLVLYPGRTGGEPLPPGSMILSTDMPAGLALLQRGAVDRPQRRDAVAGLLAMLPPLVGEAESLVTTLEQLLARLDTRLMGPADEPAAGLLTTVDTTTREFGDLAAAVGRSATELDAVVANLAAFSAHLADPAGLIPTLLGDEGSAAQLFHDQAALYARLTAAMDELVALTGFLNGTAPEIGILMDETIRTLSESEKVLQGLKNNPILRGGIPPAVEAPGTFEGRRTEGG